MKRQFFLTLITLTSLGALFLTAPAQTKIHPDYKKLEVTHKVTLACTPYGAQDFPSLAVSNPTAQDIPKGTLIHATVKIGGGGTVNTQMTDPEVLKKNKGNEVILRSPAGRATSCEAWADVL